MLNSIKSELAEAQVRFGSVGRAEAQVALPVCVHAGHELAWGYWIGWDRLVVGEEHVVCSLKSSTLHARENNGLSFEINNSCFIRCNLANLPIYTAASTDIPF